MLELQAKILSMVTETLGGLTAIFAAVAGLSLAVLLILAVVTHNDVEKSAKIKSLVWILGACAAFGAAGALVTWAM